MNRTSIIDFIKKAPCMKPDEMTPEQKEFYNKSWADLTDDEKNLYMSAWETEAGTLEYAVKHSGTPSEIATATKVIKSIINGCDEEADVISITELLRALEHVTAKYQ